MSEAPEREEWVNVASFTQPFEAHTAASALEAADIDVEVANSTVVGVLPHMANAFGGVVVRVRADDAERAREVLATAAAAPAADDAAGPVDGPAFPEGYEPVLDSPRMVFARRAWRGALLGLGFLPLVLHLLSLWNLVKFARASGPTPQRARRMAFGALLVNVLVLAAIGILVVTLATPRRVLPDPEPESESAPLPWPEDYVPRSGPNGPVQQR